MRPNTFAVFALDRKALPSKRFFTSDKNMCIHIEYFPDQLRKPSQNPTTRWIFFCFLGLHVVILNGRNLIKKKQLSGKLS